MGDSCRIFYISEILRVILDYLAEDKGSLLHLAYCSRALSDPALDHLWADMDSFAPFVPLLPKEVQVIWDLRFNVTGLSLIQCPPPEEWRLFDTYARRVRRIRPGQDYLDRALYQRLVVIRAGIDLFPKLLSLRCYLFNPVTPGTKLFPSSLRSLALYPEYALVLDGRAELSLRQAACDSPLLEEVYVVGIYRLWPDVDPRPLEFKRLHTIHLIANMLRPVDLRSFTRLLSASQVRILRISLRSSSEVSFESDETDGQPASDNFRYLETIAISDGPRRAGDIISQITSPYLHTVIIEHRDRFATVAEYGRFFNLLAQRATPIQCLDVRMGRIYANTRSEYVRGFVATLEPLVHAGLRNLRVGMSLYGAWKIEEDVRRMLRPEAWPTLDHFEFALTEASTLGNPAILPSYV